MVAASESQCIRKAARSRFGNDCSDVAGNHVARAFVSTRFRYERNLGRMNGLELAQARVLGVRYVPIAELR